MTPADQPDQPDRPDRPARLAAEGPTLSDAFWAVARQLRTLRRESLAQWDIAPSHARALAVLDGHGTMRLSELSDQLHIAARSTTEVVDALEARGLARRRADAADRRATLVELTEQGSAVAEAIRSARDVGSETFFAELTKADRAELTRLLHLLADRT